MGLDQYLTKRHYVKNWDHMRPDELHHITVVKGSKLSTIKPERISEIVEQVAYWRKANQIHNWFVENCQEGKDECQDAYVEREKLVLLLGLVSEVLLCKSDEVAREKLPPSAGFFFGGTEIDEDYWTDLEETKKLLTDILAEPEDDASFYYHSSW